MGPLQPYMAFIIPFFDQHVLWRAQPFETSHALQCVPEIPRVVSGEKDGGITPPSSAVAIRGPVVGSLLMSISVLQMAKNCMVETGASSRMTLTGMFAQRMTSA